jgi:hypothetical protein
VASRELSQHVVGLPRHPVKLALCPEFLSGASTVGGPPRALNSLDGEASVISPLAARLSPRTKVGHRAHEPPPEAVRPVIGPASR